MENFDKGYFENKYKINKYTCEKLGVFTNREDTFVKVVDTMGLKEDYIKINRKGDIEVPDFDFEPCGWDSFSVKTKHYVITDKLIDMLTIAQLFKFTIPVLFIPNEEVLKSFSILTGNQKVSIINNKKTYLNEAHKYFQPQNVINVKIFDKDINKLYREKEITLIQNMLAGKDIKDGTNLVDTESMFKNGLEFNTAIRKYPFQGMNDLLGGLNPNEIIVIPAGSAGGKTDMGIRLMKSLVDQGDKVGLFLMEQKFQQAVLFQMAADQGDFKYDIKELVKYSKDVNSELMQKYFNEIEKFKDKVYIFNTKNININLDLLEIYIRQYVKVLGCKHIMIDHITYFAHMAGSKGIEETGKFMSLLVRLVAELDCTFIVTTQVHKMGGAGKDAEDGSEIGVGDMFGSSAINHAATLIMSLERNSKSEDNEEKNTTTCRILKSRDDPSAMGKTFELWYNEETGKKIDKCKRYEYEAYLKKNEIPF